MQARFYATLWLKSKISQFFRTYLGASLEALLIKQDSISLLIPASDLSMARSVSKKGSYNKPLLNKLSELVTKESRVLFVGTHVGSLLIPIAQKCNQVIGIEANPGTFELLKKNLILNEIRNVEIHNVAAFDSKTKLRFLVSHENTGGSKIISNSVDSFLYTYDHPSEIEVSAMALDDLITNPQFDLIVMDVEGAEYNALLGMKNILAASDQLVLEVLPHSIQNVARSSPEKFFSAIPDYFNQAQPIHVPDLKPVYQKQEFLELYKQLAEERFLAGADVLFSKTKSGVRSAG